MTSSFLDIEGCVNSLCCMVCFMIITPPSVWLPAQNIPLPHHTVLYSSAELASTVGLTVGYMLQDVSSIHHSDKSFQGPRGGKGGEDPSNVSLVRTRCVNYFASLHHDCSGAAGQGHHNASTSAGVPGGKAAAGSAVDRLGQGEKRPFVDPPTAVLPAHKLRDLCLRALAQRVGSRRTGDKSMLLDETHGAGSRVGRTRRELKRKLRAGVAAVVFANLLTHMRLRSIAKNLESHVCEPYRVLAVAQDLEQTCGRAVCVFAAQQGVDEDLLYFALDRCPLPTEGWEWVVIPVRVEDTRMLQAQLIGAAGGADAADLKGGRIRLVDVVVIAEYDEHLRLLVPVSVEDMRGQTNTYFQMLRDFERKVNSITFATIQEGGAATGNDEGLGALASPQRNGITRTQSPTGASAAGYNAVHIDSANFLDIPLPTFQEMLAMPREVRAAVQQLALGVLSRCLLPRVLLRQRKKLRERMSRSATGYPVSVEQLLKLQTFEMWPPSLLDELIQSLRPYTAERGEIILQEKEVPCNAIYFLTSGSVQQLQKLDRSNKRISPANSKVLQMNVAGLSCFGQLSFVSNDPRMSTIRTNAMCTFWRLFRVDYMRLFAKLPVSVRTHVQDLAFQRRTQSVPYNDPLTMTLLRSMPVFSLCGDTVLKALMLLFRPMSVPPGRVLSNADGDGTAMYVLLRGRCGVFRVLRDKKEEAHVQSVGPPTMIGDDAVIGGGSHVATVKTLTSCDLYVITREEFEGCMGRFGSDWNVVVEQATKARQLRLLDSQDRFKEMAVNIPLVASVLPFAKRTELSRLFTPILYHPKQTVCSSAHFADRIIIVVEGTVRFQDGSVWECGEAAGYTCIVPHRWGQTATAVTSSKLIELRHNEYRDFLERHGALDAVRSAAQALMFPKASPPEMVYWALLATQKQHNPPMHPVSYSDTVTPCEERFGIRVVSFGQQKVHRRGAQPLPSPLEAEVQESLRRINDRTQKKQEARGIATPSAGASHHTGRASSSGIASDEQQQSSALTRSLGATSTASRDGPSVSKTWSKSRLLFMKTEYHAGETRGVRPVEHHPIMREYHEKHRKPVGFRRPSYLLGNTSTNDTADGTGALVTSVDGSGAK